MPRLSAVQGAAAPHAQPATPPVGRGPAARARGDGAGEPGRQPEVRWTSMSPGEERTAREAGGAGYGGPSRAGGPGGAGGPGDAWEQRVETLARWCRTDWPLSGTGRAAASALAVALGMRLGAVGSGNGRGALGEVVRLVLAAAQSDVAALRAALADHRAPASRALLANLAGGPWLLGVLRLRGTTVLGTELRACASREEAAAVLTALFGRGDEAGGPLPALRALAGGWVRGVRRDAPLLGDAHGGAVAEAVEADEALVLVLPLLSLEGPVPAEPPAAVLAAVNAGAPPRPASPFLDVGDARALGSPEVVRHDEEDAAAADEEDASSDADARDDDDADPEDPEDTEDVDDADDAPVLVAPVEAPAATRARPAEEEPEPMEADVMAAALERLRTRARRVERVEASVASDDGVAEHVTDVVPWLQDATLVEIRALARDGWAGDEAIEVARALAEDDPEIGEVVRHARRTESELLVEIDGRAASAWLRAHRPELAERLDDVLEDGED